MQGEALLIARKRPSRLEKSVSSILEYYYLYSCLALLCKLIAVFTPLSIRRGDGGEALFSSGEGRFFNSRILLPLFLFSITLQANSSHHSPLHSERGWGRGCRGLRVRLLFPSYCAIISLIIAMSFSSPKPERSPAEAIVAFLRMSFPSGEFSILKGV